MKRVRRRDTDAELLLRQALWRKGFRYRLHGPNLTGSPDIVLLRANTVIFVDGDFWHGRILIEQGARELRRSFRGARSDYWVQRIKRNVARDILQTRDLMDGGWNVVRVWETTILRKTTETLGTIVKALSRNRRARSTFLRL